MLYNTEVTVSRRTSHAFKEHILEVHAKNIHLEASSSQIFMRSSVRTDRAPAAIGPYSQAILTNDTLYCSGQIAIDPETGVMVTDSLEAETERVLDNLGAVLRAVQMNYEHVVRCAVFLTNIDDYAQVNEVYARYFREDPPARETVAVKALPRGARVEISCIAVRS